VVLVMQSFFNICSVYEQEKNRINKDGEIVISSTKTRTQKSVSAPCFFLLSLFPICRYTIGLILLLFLRGNIDDALAKLQVSKIL